MKANIFNPSKVHTEFRNNISSYNPVIGRKYTITHSDETAELFVTIGTEYATDLYSPIRDELILSIDDVDNNIILQGYVNVDSHNNFGTRKLRNDIFLREIPLALKSTFYADRIFFQNYNCLMNVPVIINFLSADKQYNKRYYYGTIGNFTNQKC